MKVGAPERYKRADFLKIESLFEMPSKSNEVHKLCTELRRKIEKKKAEHDRATNLRQKAIKNKKIEEWEEEIKVLLESIHGKSRRASS